MTLPTNTYSSIQLKGIELSLHFGWYEKERLQPQIIQVDVDLRFAQPPKACLSDDLVDTYCYDELIKNITIETSSRHFKLVEHLSFHVYQTIKKLLPDTTQVRVTIMKKPPIVNLSGGVIFAYGDPFP